MQIQRIQGRALQWQRGKQPGHAVQGQRRRGRCTRREFPPDMNHTLLAD